MRSENIRMVKQNLQAYVAKCLSANPDFEIMTDDNIFFAMSDMEDPLLNAAFAVDVMSNDIANTIEKIRSYYNRQKRSFYWWLDVSSDAPELSLHFEKNQFELCDDVMGMVADFESMPVMLPRSSAIEVMQVSSDEDLEKWLTPIHIGFNFSAIKKEKYFSIQKKLNQSDSSSLHFIAKYQDTIIGSSTLFLDKTAGIYNCATLPEYRRLGALSALTVAMLNKAKESGYKKVMLQALTTSVDLFRKHGFQDVVPYKLYLMKR